MSVRIKKRSQKLADDNNNRFKALLWPIIIIVIIAILDQVTKMQAVANLKFGEAVSVIGTFLQFKLVYNIGGALGTNLGSSIFYLVSSSLILIVVFYFIYNYRNFKNISWPMALIAGGAVGNIIDRVRFGQVVDFIDVDFFNMNLFGYQLDRWWIFNIADAAITVGVIFLIISMLFGKKESFNTQPADKIKILPDSETTQ